MVAEALGLIANRTNGSIELGTFTFAQPERTGVALANGQISASIKCPKVANAGCRGASVAGSDGNSTCIGCAGTVSVTVSGLGAFVSSGNSSGCACRSDGTVLSPPSGGSLGPLTEPTVGKTATQWTPVAQNPQFYVVDSTSEHSNCSTANCSCDGGTASGPDLCGCSCTQHSCNTMHFNHSVAQTGNNCSCSNSGVASGDTRCGCSCQATVFTCDCTRQTCGSTASADGKTFTSTGGTSTWGGGTCQVTASCSAGFYDGAVYSAYGTTPGNVFAELIGPDGSLESSKLGGTSASFSAGVFKFQNLYANGVAMRTTLLQLKIHAGASGQRYLSSPETVPFAAWPSTFKVVQTADTTKETYVGDGSEYKVNDQGFAELGNYTLYLLDSQKTIITLLGGDFNATVDLITGANTDSSNCHSTTGLNYPTAFTDLTVNSTDPLSPSRYITSLVVLNRNTGGAGASITNHELTKDDTNSMRFGIQIRGQVGNCFALLFKTDWITDQTKHIVMKNAANGYFRIVPGKIAVAHGDSQVVFQNGTTPAIVRVDGGQSNATMNVDGLPNPLHVLFQDGAGTTLEHASCLNCVQVRLVKCVDSNAGSPTDSSAPYPACASVAQAECAGSTSSKCRGDYSYLDTLTGTTLVNMVHGIATFTDIQVSFVVGAGYKLQFTHNAMDATTTAAQGGAKFSRSKTFLLTSPTAENVQALMPPASWLKNSFFVRPYSMTVTKIGGDGVDEDQDGKSDGVATGIPFRWQPTVVLKGKDYDFNSPANMHGWTPVFAEINNCGGDSCAGKNITLSSGGATPPAYNYAEFIGDTMQFSGTATKQTVVHAKQLESVVVSLASKVGFAWKDLKINTNDTATYQNSMVLTFKVGPGGLGDQFTSVDSNVFDVFTAPDPPHNLRVYSYDELGFRLEFDPAPVSEAQPLTGYIIEVDECYEDATRCTKRGTTASPVCAAEIASRNLVWTAGTTAGRGGLYNSSTQCFADKEGPGYWISPDVTTLTGQVDYFKFEMGLGGDWTTGGGGTEEVLLNYSSTTPGTDSEVGFSLRPSRTLLAEDELVFDFGLTYKFKVLAEFTGTSCTFTGDHASLVEVSAFDSFASTLTLKVKTGQVMLAGKPVTFVAPETCKIKLPPKNDTSNGFGNTKPTSTIMYAALLGKSNTSRGDNCKGTTPGCVAKTTYVLPLITDSSPSDTTWSGTTTGGGNDDACTSGKLEGSKLCTLSIGQDWSMGASVNFIYTNSSNSTSTPLIEINFSRDRALAEGDWIDVPVRGLVNTQPSEGQCDYFLESGTQTPKGPARWSSVTSSGLANFSNTDVLCRTLKSEVGIIKNGVKLTGWETLFDVTNSKISVYVGSGLLAKEQVTIFVHGLSANTLVSPGNVAANVRRGSRTTVIFKNKANTLTYSTLDYNPVGTRAITQQGLTLEAGKIYNFRVYAYNGRFKSAAAQTRVQNRAITKPAIPAYFSQIKQEVIGVEMRFTNLLETYVSSTTNDGTNPPISAPAGESARVGMRFTSQFNVEPGAILTVALPKFTHTSGYLRIGAGSMFADKYFVDGMVHTSLNMTLNNTDYTKPDVHRCGCGHDGTVSTPRNRYRVTRSSSGLNATNSTTEVITGVESPAVPQTACGGCSCSFAGVPATPPAIYETSGNCSSCACDAYGVSSHVAPYQVVQKSAWEGTYNSTEQGCVCSSSGLMSSSTGGNCTMFECQLQVCDCSCPLVLSCECGCELYESYKCKCSQTENSELFESALWSSAESSLVLTVGKKGLVKDQQETFFISKDVGIKTPAISEDFDKRFKPPQAREWGFRNEALLPEIKLNWVSSHPTSSQPRLGFVAQITTDLNWKTDIQTVHFPDASWDMLSEGFTMPSLLGTTSAAVSAMDTVIPLAGAEWLMPGQTIVVSTSPDDESLRVVLANSTHINVIRTRYLAHASGAAVNLWDAGALDVDRPSQLERAGAGFDLKVGSPGEKAGETSCRIGNPVYAAEGCNPSKRIFPNTIRHFNLGTIKHGVNNLTSLVSACGGNTTHCSLGCNCIDNSVPVNGADLGSLRPTGMVKLASSGDVLAYPLDFRGRLVVGVTATSEVLVLDMDTSLLLGNYIRVGDEIMFVKSIGGRKGAIKSVGVHRTIGGSQCQCDITGTASGGTGCSCFPTTGSQGTNCTAAGTLALKEGAGGGSGFAASFTVASGKISSITVTDPGQGYGTVSSSDVVITTGGSSDANHPCQVDFYPAITPQYVTVSRAQLGTTARAAMAGVMTFAVLWASQTSTKQPTKRYSIRLAAYNSAGMSPFLYYDLDLKQKSLQKFLTAGNQLLEISLVGGGVVSNNVSVHFVTPGTTDITKGKECSSAQLLDKAGTRLTCRTPSWVGAKLDLIVSYKSGIFSDFVVGGGWVSYTPPTVQSVTPALHEIAKPGVSIELLVQGSGFGTDSNDVTGKLVGPSLTSGDVPGEIPCKPLVVITDTSLKCTLTTKSKDETWEGDIVITAGNATFHGGGQSSQTGPGTSIKQKPPPVEVKATIAADFTEITSSPAKVEAFKATFASETASALGIASHLLEVLSILQGSVIVIFNILPDTSSANAVSPAALAVNLAQQAADPNSKLRKGSLTGAITVSLPPGTAELAAAESKSTVKVAVPAYFRNCVPRTYNAWDMEICYDCCTYLCETGTEVPQMGGFDVLPGYRAQVCQSECMNNCGYARLLSLKSE